jgi:PH domain
MNVFQKRDLLLVLASSRPVDSPVLCALLLLVALCSSLLPSPRLPVPALSRFPFCSATRLGVCFREQDSHPLGVVNLKHCTIGNSSEREFCFALNKPGRTHYFAAEDAEEQCAWMDAIQDCIINW